ncbi:MAG: ferritin-like domain-containing protein [Sporichthyaceae bacterium]
MASDPARLRAGPTRRSILAAGTGVGIAFLGGGLLTGCITDDPLGGPDQTPTPDPDVALRATAVTDKQDLVARYDATLVRFPGLGPTLTTARADHLAHLARLGGEPRPVTSVAPTPGTSAPPVAASRERAVSELVAAERSAATRRLAQCVRAGDPELARLLAAIGGCEAAHAAVLGSAQ